MKVFDASSTAQPGRRTGSATRTAFTTTVTTGLLACALGAQAQPPGAPPHGPPPEAYAACLGKTEGDSVTVTLRDGRMVNGICRTMAGQLVAMPDHRAPGTGGEPPPAR